MSPDALQYGALGLLALVLAAVFALIRQMFQRQAAQADKNFEFVKEQVETVNAERAGVMEAWVEAHRDQIRASVVTAEALGRIQENLGEILIAMRRMNGKEEKP